MGGSGDGGDEVKIKAEVGKRKLTGKVEGRGENEEFWTLAVFEGMNQRHSAEMPLRMAARLGL